MGRTEDPSEIAYNICYLKMLATLRLNTEDCCMTS